MSLATRVFMLFSALMILMLGSQWYMMRSITQEVSSELGNVAFSVAKDTASYFVLNDFNWLMAPARNERFTHQQSIRTQQGGRQTVTVVEMAAPTIEIRIDNQRTDEVIQLISGNRSASIPLPREAMIDAVKSLEQQMIISTLMILGVGLLLAALLARRLMQPVGNLASAASRVAKGELGTQISQPDGFASAEIQSSIDSFNDMSRRLSQMQTENQRLQANAHYKELGYISSGLAHSIRNPLNTLGLTIEQMADSVPDKSQGERLVESAHRQIARIDNWVRTFMTFALGANAETGQITVSEVIQTIRLEAGQLRPDVSIEVSHEGDLIIDGIEAEIHAIFHSLLINAVEASPQGATVKLICRAGDHICCHIVDQGSGIPESMKSELFKPHKTTKSKGSGMGLYMAQKLAENRYGGNIELCKTGSEGTEILLTLGHQRKVNND